MNDLSSERTAGRRRDPVAASGGAGISRGCLLSLFSAILTAVLLFVNGALVLAVISALARADVRFMDKPAVTQFMLFLIPIVLVVVEWMMLDYVRTHLVGRRRSDAADEP